MAEEYSSVMFGRKLELERCEACVNHISYTMQFAIARIFVDERFDDESKANTNQIIDYIQDALLQMIDDASWMDELTKNTAKQKILLMHRNIGFPDWIKNDTELNEYYESLDFSPTDYFGNYLQYIKWGIKKNFESLRKPVDRTEWPFGPAKVNTFYNAAYNDLVLSAGILQGTFYHKDSPSYLNFGGIGAIIGHEMTHAVDAGGRMYNSSGNYMKWWSNSSIQAYVKLENCFLKQYSTYRVEECNINLNSHKTLGENIADNAGLKAAYMGYKLWVKDNGEEPWIPGMGFSPEQLFFINFGQVWCSKYTEQSARYQVLFGSHSPGRIRCNGSVMNSQEFSTTFSCPPGYMNPANKCSIW
ncbi:endothelin-converting enzyme 1-like [Saccoglossus kowalevskii]